MSTRKSLRPGAEPPGSELPRRTVLRTAAAGTAVPLLAACGGGSTTPDTGAPPDGPGSTEPSPGQPEQQPDGVAGGLVTTGEVPVGGGVVLPDERIVVTQPAAGEFHAFSAVCTHQGCLVTKVVDGQISCPCHGSLFSAEDGSVVGGPARSPLEGVPVSVQGDRVVRG